MVKVSIFDMSLKITYFQITATHPATNELTLKDTYLTMMKHN